MRMQKKKIGSHLKRYVSANRSLLRYVEEETGRTIDMVDWIADPLGYDELVAIRPDEPAVVPVNLRHATVFDEKGERVFPEGRDTHVKFTLNSKFSSNVVALSDGGWLPSIFAAHDRLILADRNVISEIQARFLGGRTRSGVADDFFDVLARGKFRINPLLYAIEGNERRTPTDAEIAAQIKEAIGKVQKALPHAIIEPTGRLALQGVTGLLRDGAAGMRRKTVFLKTVAPRLTASARKNRLADTCCWILAQADDAGVPRQSLAVVAALSAALCPQSINPAKKLLKPSTNYKDKNAYNALCDLRSLELFIGAKALFPDHPISLFTKDRSLALFWCGLNVHDIRMVDGVPTYRFSTDRLLPELAPSIVDSLEGK